MSEFRAQVLVDLDEHRFGVNLRTSKRAAAGASGMTSEHSRPLLDRPADLHLLFQVGEILARGEVSGYVAGIIRLGRLTALQKPGGGVRGIVAGDILRRLVGRKLAQQLGKAVEAATSLFQYAHSTRAGSECVVHVLQALTERNSEATVLSIDGISAFDVVSRNAMLESLRRVPGGDQVLPSVLMFYGTPSTHLWNDSNWDLHKIEQGRWRAGKCPNAVALLFGATSRTGSCATTVAP